VVSPWSKGGWVNSQLFDHTSLIRFLEARFGEHHPDLIETNITPWRRTVVGDLMSCFDFRAPSQAGSVVLPDTDSFKPVDLVRFPDEEPVPPAVGAVPAQEKGVKAARALPYALDADARVDGRSLEVRFRNSGDVGAVFQVRSDDGTTGPWTYTLGAHTHLSDDWEIAGEYGLAIHGPNGFFRRFKGTTTMGAIEVRLTQEDDRRGIRVEFRNTAGRAVTVNVLERYAATTTTVQLAPGDHAHERWSVAKSHGWYDLLVSVEDDPAFAQHYAGHLENGEDSISDPLMGGLV